MPFANPVGGVIVQTGTDSDFSDLQTNTGVTYTNRAAVDEYDFGSNRLEIQGTCTLDGGDDAKRERIYIGVGGSTQNVDINITSTGSFTLGNLAVQGGVEYATGRHHTSIVENGATDFGDGNGNISNDGGTTDAFINVEGGGTFNWYGCIDSTGGMRFKGANDGSSASEANVTIRGGVLDARRMTERASGEADQFIYNYSDNLDIAPPNGMSEGLTILTAARTGTGVGDEHGLAILQLGEPTALKGYESVFSSQALGGSNSAPSDLTYTVEDYTGIIGHPVNNIDLRSASSTAANTSVIIFLNSAVGSTLRLATQDPAYNMVEARQTVRGTLTDAAGVDRIDAIMATENKNNTVTSALISAGAFALGNIKMTEWNDDNPPTPTYFSPSNTDDDLWSFYVYSYLGADRDRLDVRLRGIGGTDVDFISPDDGAITQTNRTTVDGYNGLSDLGRVYDRQKSYKVDTANVNKPSLSTPIIVASGTTLDAGALRVNIDGTTPTPFTFTTGTPDSITIGTSTLPSITKVGATTEAIVESPEASSIQIAFPAGIQDDDVAYITVCHAESEDNTWTTPTGWASVLSVSSGGTPDSTPEIQVYRRVLSSDSGSVTITGNFVSGIVAQMRVYRNVDTTTPEDQTATSSGASGDPDPPSVTTTGNGALVMAFAVGDGEQTVNSGPSGYGTVEDTLTTAGGTEGSAAGAITVPETPAETFSATEQASHTINLPTFQVGDLVVMHLNHSPSGTATIGTVNTPSGWDIIGVSTETGAASNSRLTIFRRFMQGGDSSTVSVSTSTDMTVGCVAVGYRGVDQTTPLDVAVPAMGTGTGAVVSPTITTVTDNAWVVRAGIVDGTSGILQNGDEPAGHTARGFMNNNPPSNGMSLGVADEIQVTAGSAGTATWGNAGTEEYVGATYALRPGPGRSLDGCVMSSADVFQASAGAEDPGVFDFSESVPWAAATIALTQASGVGTTSLSKTSKFDEISTTDDVHVDNGATVNGLTFTCDEFFLDEVMDLTDVTVNGNLRLSNAGTYNFSNVTVTGDTTNEDAAGNAQINASNGTSVTTSEPGTGNGQVNIVNTVTVSVTALDASDASPIEGARVYIEAAAGGPLAAGTEILNALTNASGVAETTTFNYTADQPITGNVRKGTVVPTYKAQSVTGTIVNTGFATNTSMTSDD